MTRIYKIDYPWIDTPPKGAFFVPTLQLEKVKAEGLTVAIHKGVLGKASFGVVKGKLGVIFTRVR